MYATVFDDGEEKPFCVCLTCKKGVFHGPMDRQGARWIAIHSKETNCKVAHRTAMTAFRQTYYTPDEPNSDMVTVLWEECRADKHMRGMIEEVRAFCAMTDGKFVAAEGFKQTLRHASSYKKEAAKSQSDINRMVIDHEKELVEMRTALVQYKRDNQILRESLVIKSDEIDALCLRLATVEEELNVVKAAHGCT
jgi:hypothetical protein